MRGRIFATAGLLALTMSITGTHHALADDTDHPTPYNNAQPQLSTRVSSSVQSGANGADIQITVRQHFESGVNDASTTAANVTVPGLPSLGVVPPPVGFALAPPTTFTGQPVSVAPGGASLHHETSRTDSSVENRDVHAPKVNDYSVQDARLQTFTIGAGDGSAADLQSRPTGAVPAFTANGQFQGLVTLPGAPVPVTAAPTPDAVVPPAPAPQPPAVAAAPPSGGGGPDPRDIAMDIRGHVPLSDIQIGVNPSPAGIVAIPSWYWVKGYDGQAFGASRTVDIPAEIGAEVPIEGPGAVPADDPRRQGTSFSVEVHIAPTRYQWSFGDGSALEGHSLGQAYPATSDIQHTYQYSSLRQPGGFPVTMTVTFSADYRVNGGVPQGLPPITRTSQMTYRVQEIQTVLTSR